MSEENLYEMMGKSLTRIDNLASKIHILECKLAGHNIHKRMEDMEIKLKMMAELYDRQNGKIAYLQHEMHCLIDQVKELRGSR